MKFMKWQAVNFHHLTKQDWINHEVGKGGGELSGPMHLVESGSFNQITGSFGQSPVTVNSNATLDVSGAASLNSLMLQSSATPARPPRPLTWPSAPGIEFTVLRSTTLEEESWRVIATVPAEPGASTSFTDPEDLPRAFHRIGIP